ncbi:hypothetical protein [Actinomadura sp. HBU206391]|uniref:hypothetical protein n=1 Tax=Actinomadura sp. HBU206391 TaxID=2731692 RepID=UPI0016505BDA|nr:hypothetical protein [Actinomadura sp. HBU206391]MBC6459508.1 hypothetical protein [Actinomadura sp. HBU206391]
MKMLTIVLAATATAGTVAAGGAAIALTANDEKAPSNPVAANVAAPSPKVSVPATLPVDPTKCVQLPEGHLPDTSKVDLRKLKGAELEKLKAKLEVEWLKSKLPVDEHAALPVNGAEAVKSGHAKPADPKAVKEAVNKAVARLHAGVPACLPSLPHKPGDIKDLPAGVPAVLPTDIPRLPKFSCDSVTPVVKVGGSVEQQITAKTGLKFVSKKTRTITVKGRKICVMTQRWSGPLGQWMEVERIKGEVNVEQLRQTLRLPNAEAVTLGRDIYWRSPLAGAPGTGIMWAPAPGVVDYVSGGLALQPRLQQIAMRLHEVK